MVQLKTGTPFIAMGATAMILQIIVLRLLLSTFSGNELDIGITLSIWLIYAGLGSYAGRKVRSRDAFALSFLLMALFALPAVIAIKAIRPALSLGPGETVSLASIILSTGVTLLPVGFLAGLQFPLAVSYAEDEKSAGRVYGLESLGAFIGGMLFTFVFASRVQTFELCLIVALFNVLMAAYVSRKKMMAVMLLIPILLYSGFHGMLPALPWSHMELIQTSESKYGEISVVSIRDQVSIYASGHLLFTHPDLPAEEMDVHLPMTLHPSPAKVLVIGGSPGTIKEFLKYPVAGVDFIELDPRLISVSQGLLTAPGDRKALEDKRIKIAAGDGRRFITALKRRTYDLILIDLPPPVSAGINRFYTTDFFRSAKTVLNDKGILYINLPASTGYIGKSMQTANGSLYNSLKSVFSRTGVTAQECGGFFASDSDIPEDPRVLEDRFVTRHIRTEHFSPYVFRDAFDPLGTNYVKGRLNKITTVNTDLRPSAYLYNLMLWSEAHGGKWLSFLLRIRGMQAVLLLIAVFSSVSLLIFRKKDRTVFCSIFTTGFSGMTFTVSVLLAYQAMYGYVYEMIGVIPSIFMIGLWLGSLLIKRPRNPLRTLFYLETVTMGLAGLSPLFFSSGPLILLFVLLSGTLTGCLFSAANAASSGRETAGKLYGMDLAGSFSGALIPAIIVIPLFGLYNALLLTATLKAFSAAMIRSVRE
jgi:spermidine synthase